MSQSPFADLPDFAEADANQLVQHLGAFAEQMINRHGEFHPFGAAFDRQGELQLLAAQLDEGASPPETYAALIAGLRSEPDRWRSACLALNIVHPEYGDAINMSLDFSGADHGLIVVVAYRAGGLFRKARFEGPRLFAGPQFAFDGPLGD